MKNLLKFKIYNYLIKIKVIKLYKSSQVIIRLDNEISYNINNLLN